MALPQRQQLALVVLVLAVAGLVVVTVVRLRRSGADTPSWPQHYYCDNGHHWTAELTDKPVCPTCGRPAIQSEKYICPKCRKVFIGYETRKLDVGRFDYRLPGSDQWVALGPDSLTCPYCNHTDNPYEFPKPRWDTDPAPGTVIQAPARPALPPEQAD